MEGDTVIFDCILDSEVDIEWTLDDEKLEESEFIKFQTKKDGTELLVLEDVTIDYAGHYGVTATNSNGSISCMAELVIHGIFSFLYPMYKLAGTKLPRATLTNFVIIHKIL